MEKLFSDQLEPVTRELRAYIEDWRHFIMKENHRRTCTRFLAKYGRLFIYDIPFEKIQSVDDEAIHFVKRYVYTLIGKPDHIYGTLTDHEYSFIHDDLFDRILATDQNPDILLKLIHKDVTLTSSNDNSAYSKPKFRSMSEFFTSSSTPE